MVAYCVHHIFLLECGSNILYRWLVHDITNVTRIKILTLINYMLHHKNMPEVGRKKLLLKDGLLDGIGELLCKQEICRDVVVHFLKLALSSDRSFDFKTDIYTEFGVVLTVFKIVQFQTRPVKLEVAIKVSSYNSVLFHVISTIANFYLHSDHCFYSLMLARVSYAICKGF